MKFTKTIIVALALIAFGIANIKAGPGYSVFASPGTALNLGTNYVVFPPDSLTGGEPLVTYLNVTTFNGSGAAATLTSYVSTNQTTCFAANSTTTLAVNQTNGFTAGQYVVIQHLSQPVSRFRNEAAVISSVNANGTNIVLQTAPTTACAAGDVVNAETSWASIPFGATTSTTASVNGPGILSGQRQEPFLLVLSTTGSGTNTINTANAVYQP